MQKRWTKWSKIKGIEQTQKEIFHHKKPYRTWLTTLFYTTSTKCPSLCLETADRVRRPVHNNPIVLLDERHVWLMYTTLLDLVIQSSVSFPYEERWFNSLIQNAKNKIFVNIAEDRKRIMLIENFSWPISDSFTSN